MNIIKINLFCHLALCYLSLKLQRFPLDGGNKDTLHINELDFDNIYLEEPYTCINL